MEWVAGSTQQCHGSVSLQNTSLLYVWVLSRFMWNGKLHPERWSQSQKSRKMLIYFWKSFIIGNNCKRYQRILWSSSTLCWKVWYFQPISNIVSQTLCGKWSCFPLPWNLDFCWKNICWRCKAQSACMLL